MRHPQFKAGYEAGLKGAGTKRNPFYSRGWAEINSNQWETGRQVGRHEREQAKHED